MCPCAHSKSRPSPSVVVYRDEFDFQGCVCLEKRLTQDRRSCLALFFGSLTVFFLILLISEFHPRVAEELILESWRFILLRLRFRAKVRRRHNNGLTLHRIVRIFFGFTQDDRLNTTAAGRLLNPKTSVSLVAHERYSRVALVTRAEWTFLMNGHANHGVTLSAANVSHASASVSE